MENGFTEPYNGRVNKLISIMSLVSALTWLGNGAVAAAELLVVEQDFCPYCVKFDREIAQAYPKTEEGERAPLHRIDLHEEWPAEYATIKKANVTPTFILVEDGQEIDRLVGYPGDEYFWFLINEMLEKLPKT